jgi:two-component system cell cycle response regulator
MKILIVDDSPVIRASLEDVLVTAGYSVTTASNGVEAMETVHNDGFDLVLLDIDMPNLSGLQVCRMLRNDPKFKELPIIMLTARDQKQDQYWGIEIGATAYLTKPFDEANLIETVESALEESAKKKETMKDALKLPELTADENEDVIFRAGELQEIQLFKMTLTNEIHQIANKQQDLPHTCRSLADLFSSVIDFDLCMFVLMDDERMKLFVYVYKPINREFFMEAKERMLDEFKRRAAIKELARDTAEVELCDPGRNMLKETGEMKLRGLEAVALDSQGNKFGMFMMARSEKGPFTRQEAATCLLITGQSAIVVDNIRMYEKIKRFAIADGLTGLYNHRYFQEQLEKEYSRARRFNLSLSLIMADIDHFKDLNDRHGHQQGDMILKGIAAIMRRSVRDIDLIARYGGEEFVVILPETPKKNAAFVADRIRKSLEEQEFTYSGGVMKATVSIGVSGQPDDEITNQLDMIAKADAAMYQAKKEGRNRVVLYSPEGRTDS